MTTINVLNGTPLIDYLCDPLSYKYKSTVLYEIKD